MAGEVRRALGYLRVSGLGQVERDGFPRQEEAIRGFAGGAGLEIAGIYRDGGVWGPLGLSERPGLIDLVSRADEEGISQILVESMSRFARDANEGELILRDLRRLGLTVLDSKGINLSEDGADNPQAKLIRSLLAVIAEFEMNSLVLRLRIARERKRRKVCRCEGPLRFAQHPGEADTLKRIRYLRRRPPMKSKPGHTSREIAEILNEEGRRSRRGGAWNAEMVRKIHAR